MKKKNRKEALGWTFWFSFMMFVENLIAVGISAASVRILKLFDWQIKIEPEFLVLIFSVVTGCVFSFATIKIFLAPLRRFNANMSLVAKGDFSIRLNGKSKIKEMNNMYTSFNKMVSELGAMETIQADFIANVSHEFKTPIGAIEGYSMLLQYCDKSDQEKYVQKILFNTKRLSNLVSSVLLLAKLDNQKIKPKFTKFSLDEQIRQAIMFQEIEWDKKQIELDVNLEDVTFFGTEELLLHVWNNLLSNAVKFSPKNGKISITLSKDEEKAVFTVSDSGPGIDEKCIPHIFNKFYQADTEHKGEGSGLGLTLAKNVVLLNNGEIAVENNVGGGCKFIVHLPLDVE